MDSRVIDRYTLELEALIEDEQSSQPVRCIATNTDDRSTAEAWLSLAMTRALLNFAYGNEQSLTDYWMRQLEDHHYADLIAQQPDAPQSGSTKPPRCVFNAMELLPFGFVHDELHPWKDE
jgi:hypothetical protein